MILVIATTNRGKLREYRTLLDGLDIELRSLSDFAAPPQVAEDGDTYLVNARLKAHAVAAHCGLPSLADDSGLEVDALDGAPGIRSARFAADNSPAARPGDDRANLALLVERLQGVPAERRTARFRCAIVVAHPDGRELAVAGTCEGLLTEQPRGGGGFGYDPLFVYPPLGRTFAELPAEEKDRVSHRALAVRALRPHLRQFLETD